MSLLDSVELSEKTGMVDWLCELIVEMKDYHENEHYVFVHTSLHLDLGGVPDDVSLNCARKNYLIKNEFSSAAICGDDLSEKYDSERLYKGVYDSVDELFSAVPYILKENHDCKDENSKEVLRTRRERKPK